MNDFTKEELQIILRLYEKCPNGTYIEDLGRFINKIQSMIDNYQEIKKPTMTNYCCPKCNEEWRECECKNE